MAKLCMVCGQDCADKPRVKDEQGNYACRECAEAATKRVSAAKVAVVAGVGQQPLVKAGASVGSSAVATASAGPKVKSPEPELSNPGVWDDLTPVVPKGAKACGSCGHAMKDEAVVCVNCGHNELTGKAMRTKREKPLVIGEVKRKQHVDPAERAAFLVPLVLGLGIGGFAFAAGAQQNTSQMAGLAMLALGYAFLSSFVLTWALFFTDGWAKAAGFVMILCNAFSRFGAKASPEAGLVAGFIWLGCAIFGLFILWKDGERPLVRGMVCGSIGGSILAGVAMAMYGTDLGE